MNQTDLLNECNDRGDVPTDFMGMFCSRCKNPRCFRAGWGTSRWINRMRTQKERLFKPNQATPDSSLYKQLNEIDFPSMLQEAMRQEIAAKRGDWEIPDVPMIPIVDGRKVTQDDNATSSVDAAIQSLAKAQGKKPLEMPKVENETPPVVAPVQEAPRALPEHFTKQGPPPQRQNTVMPGQGIMLDDSKVPTMQPVKKVTADPWAPATDKKIPVGGTVVLGGSKDGK